MHLFAVLALAIPVVCVAQTEPLSLDQKLDFHVTASVGPLALVGAAAYAGVLQEADSPEEWGQGATGYGRRLGSSVAGSVIHGTLAFGLDSTLHQDPRYFRTGGAGFWRRAVHALRGTVMTRTDSGGEALSSWRIGSAYGSAFLSNLWYPGRLNTVGLGFAEGSAQLGFGLVTNLGSEFWPDVKNKLFHRN
jgi:hypothetical protein